ncbi:putative protein kinase UbiB [Nymphon striatum]|nr:putative protein kinase UbiB [Nymphon striatum]
MSVGARSDSMASSTLRRNVRMRERRALLIWKRFSLISGWPNLRGLGADDKVAHHRQLASTAQRITGNCRDDRLAHSGPFRCPDTLLGPSASSPISTSFSAFMASGRFSVINATWLSDDGLAGSACGPEAVGCGRWHRRCVVQAGYVPADKDMDEFARALRAGFARSLNPNMNIWEVASPIVTNYITKSIGPAAVISDLADTAMVLARFGPRLPRLVEGALMAQTNPPQVDRRTRKRWFVLAGCVGAIGGAGLVVLVNALL